MMRVLFAGLIALAAVSATQELSGDAFARMPAHMKSAFYSLVEEYAPGAGLVDKMAPDKMKLITELLGTVEKRIEEEKEQIYENFKIKKESLRNELEKKLNADSAAIDAMQLKKNVTAGAIADARKELGDSIGDFKKSERAIIVAKSQQDLSSKENEQRAKQLLERNEESRADALDQATDELKMITQVRGLVNSVKDSGVLCALCGDKKDKELVGGTDADALLAKLGNDTKCNITKTAEAGIAFVKCLNGHKEDKEVCKTCHNFYAASHLAAAPCHDNKLYAEGKFSVKMSEFNKLWQKRCPKQCLCREVYEPVCGDDGQTYSNLCMSKCVDVAVSYVGRCGTKVDGGPTTEEEKAAAVKLANETAPTAKPLIVEEPTNVTKTTSAEMVQKNTHTRQVAAA